MQPEIDPRKPIIEVMARLGRATQFHIDERERHFQITDAVIIAISALLIVLAVFNVYYVRVLYNDLDQIVVSMDSMLGNLSRVDDDMGRVSEQVQGFNRHIAHMSAINRNVAHIANLLPQMSKDVGVMNVAVGDMGLDMNQLSQAMHSITPSMVDMTNSMAVMRYNVHQISVPMGSMNPVLP